MHKIVDEKEQGNKVVIGLSGGTSSFIAAYLLKIQKFDLIGVTIIQSVSSETKCSLSEDDLKRIQDFCHRLKIAHITVLADDSFSERVQNEWVSKKIEVKPWSFSCFPCHQMKMELLYEKMIELNASYLSTGHFAKIFKSESEVSVHSVHDLSLDQSSLLHRLDKKVLSSLLLPLSSLGTNEIEKLITNFSLPPSSQNVSECFNGNLSDEYFNKFSTFIKAAETQNSQLDKSLSLEEEEAFLLRKKITLIDVFWSPRENRSAPFSAYLNTSKSSYKVNVYPKTLRTVLVEFSEKMKLCELEEISLYTKKQGNSKLILSGIIRFNEEDEADEAEFLEFVF